MKENNQEQQKLERTSSCTSEIENIFQLIYKEKIEELSSYILDDKNEIWNVKRGNEITILHSACIFDKMNVVETIINNLKKRLHISPEDSLPSEEKSKNENIFKNFINAKTEIDSFTALHYASFRGNIKIIKLLIANFAEINALSTNGLNMIHKAAQGNQPSAIIYFYKKYNMDLETTDNNQLNALHLASKCGMDNSVIFLLSLGLDPNIKDKKGYTALHYAVKYSHLRIIKKLLQRGADRNILSNNLKSPIMMAKNKPEIMEIFRKKGICEKLFLKPDINQKKVNSNLNIILFIIFHIIIIILIFFILMPYFNNSIFSIIYLIISFIVFILFTYISLSDPGIMTNNEYQDLLDIVEKGERIEDFCPYCLVKNKFNSLHCLICQKCIEEFDHHCFWVGNCIGKNNYTFFFIFLIYIILNILFNLGITIYQLATGITFSEEEINSNSFPGFYLGSNSFIYNKIFRIIVSIFILIFCILFFIPLIDLFKIQLNTYIEKRNNLIDEEEYEKNRLTEKLEENNEENLKKEEWGDIKYEEEQTSISFEENAK